MTGQESKYLIRAATLIGAYCITAKIGLVMDPLGGFIALIWPPTGISIAFLLLYGRSLWPSVLIASFATNYYSGAHVQTALGIAVGNTLGALWAFYLLHHIAKIRNTLERLYDISMLFLLGAAFSTAVNATFGVLSLWLGGLLATRSLNDAWFTWWIGDSLGILVVAPFLLLWLSTPLKQINFKWFGEGIVFFVLTALTSIVVFETPSIDIGHDSLAYLIFPFHIWAALRYGLKGVTSSIIIVSTLAVWGTAHGLGPFVESTLRGRLFYLDLFLAVQAVTAIMLATVMAERKRSEDSLRESEVRFRVLSDAAPVLIWTSGPDKLCTYFNKLWLSFTGRTLEQELGNGWAEGVHSDDLERCLETYVSSFDQRKEFMMEYQLRRHDGEYRWVIDHGVPRYTPDGVFIGYIGSCMDITAQKNVERELSLAVRARDEFLSIASHELRTPLTAMHFQVQLLERMHRKGGASSMPESTTVIAGLQVELERFAKLTSNILDVSRLTEDRMHLEIEDVDLEGLLKRTLKRHELEIQNSGSVVELIVRSPTNGKWDRLRMEQIVTNLLTNALKYGEGKPIEIEVGSADGICKLVVRDHGIGISNRDQKRIFQRFERAVPIEHFGGLGLGLWITHQIVNVMDGTIRVKSTVGEGSEFTVLLPLRILEKNVAQEVDVQTSTRSHSL